MKVVIAPDSFKESLTALEVADAVEKGFRSVFPIAELVKIPMSDGGEGTKQSLIDALGGEIIDVIVTGPLGNPVKASYGLYGNGKKAMIEMAEASGIHLVPPRLRNPLFTSTRGTGELILDALNKGVDHIIIGVGGSVTNDGGSGMAMALGARLLNKEGELIEEGGGALNKLSTIDLAGLDPRIKTVEFVAACDVENPLIGSNGASVIYGPQKGATSEMVITLDKNLTHFSSIICRDLGKQIGWIPGGGAGGGLGAGLLTFLNAELKRGVDIIIDAVDLEKHVQFADLVITGEGKLDKQTILGKTPIGVAKIAKKYHIPVIALAGLIADDCPDLKQYGIDAIFSVVPGVVTLDDAYRRAFENIEKTAENIASIVRMFMK